MPTGMISHTGGAGGTPSSLTEISFILSTTPGLGFTTLSTTYRIA